MYINTSFLPISTISISFLTYSTDNGRCIEESYNAAHTELQSTLRAYQLQREDSLLVKNPLKKGRERERETWHINFHPARGSRVSAACTPQWLTLWLLGALHERDASSPFLFVKRGPFSSASSTARVRAGIAPRARHARIDLSIMQRYSPPWHATWKWACSTEPSPPLTLDMCLFPRMEPPFPPCDSCETFTFDPCI